jgi:hypothetical protein
MPLRRIVPQRAQIVVCHVGLGPDMDTLPGNV